MADRTAAISGVGGFAVGSIVGFFGNKLLAPKPDPNHASIMQHIRATSIWEERATVLTPVFVLSSRHTDLPIIHSVYLMMENGNPQAVLDLWGYLNGDTVSIEVAKLSLSSITVYYQNILMVSLGEGEGVGYGSFTLSR